MREFKLLRLRRINITDLKGEYQKRAEEIVTNLYPEEVEFYDLSEEEQTRIYVLAMSQIDEELQEAADNTRKEKGMS